MNEESCSCGSERTRRETSRSKEWEKKRKRAGSAIRVISYGCLVETGTTLVSINRRPISRLPSRRTTGWEGPREREIGKGGTRRRLTNNNYGPGNITGSAFVIGRLVRWVHYVVHEIRSPGRSFPSRHRDRRSFLGSSLSPDFLSLYLFSFSIARERRRLRDDICRSSSDIEYYWFKIIISIIDSPGICNI